KDMLLARPVKVVAGIRAWSSRHRKVQTLLSFARTEAGGAIDIAKAAECNDTPALRAHLLRHAADEARHAAMFRQRAREVQADAIDLHPPPPPLGGDLLPTTAASERGSLSLTDHGFLPSDSYATLGELRYVTMLYLAERDAKSDFRLHFRLNARRDPA